MSDSSTPLLKGSGIADLEPIDLKELKHETYRSNGIDIPYYDVGDKSWEPVLLLHAHLASADNWYVIYQRHKNSCTPSGASLTGE